MPGGRPTVYDPAYCDRIVELGKQGMSIVQMACEFNVSRATMETNWTAAHPEFLEAFTLAKQFSQAYWEKLGSDNLITPQGVNFQSSVWSRSMAARFPHDWRESQKVEATHANPDGSPLSMVVQFVASNPSSANEGERED